MSPVSWMHTDVHRLKLIKTLGKSEFDDLDTLRWVVFKKVLFFKKKEAREIWLEILLGSLIIFHQEFWSTTESPRKITKNFDQLQKALWIILFHSRNVHNPGKIITASDKVIG